MGKLNNESKFKKLFENINIYGLPFSIRYKNRSTYTSKTGIMLSILSIALFWRYRLAIRKSRHLQFYNVMINLNIIQLT